MRFGPLRVVQQLALAAAAAAAAAAKATAAAAAAAKTGAVTPRSRGCNTAECVEVMLIIDGTIRRLC